MIKKSRAHHFAVAAAVLATVNVAVVLPTGSAAADTPSPLHGTVTMPDGSPAQYARVTVSLISPNADTTTGIEPILATTTTGKDGSFSIPVPVTSDVAAAVLENGGVANLELDAEDLVATAQGTAGATTDLTLYLGNFAIPVPDDTVNTTLDMAQPVELALDDTSDMGTYDTANPSVQIPGPGGPPCSDTGWYTVYGPEAGETKIGEIHAYQDTRSVRWAYTTSANTSIDVGYSHEGGSYSVSGSVHIGNSNGVNNGGVLAGSYYGKNIVAHFNYVKEQDVSRCFYGNSYGTRTTDRVRATVWNGDEYAGSDMSWEDGYNTWKENEDAGGSDVAKFTPYQTFSRTTDKTSKYGFAVTILGATLGSQTTMDTHHYEGWKFGPDAAHYLIGDTSPPSTAGTIFAY